MKNQAVIGVVQGDGRILAARVARSGGSSLQRTLNRHYSTRLRATMLVSLGDIATVGPTPSTSRLTTEEGEPALVDPCGFETMRDGDARHAHLFDGTTWSHWSETLETATFTIEEE